MRHALCLSLLLSIIACDGGGPDTPPPVDGSVSEYLQGLPRWSEFRPNVQEQPPTATGAPVTEAPVLLDVEVVEDDGSTSLLEDVTYSCTSTPYSLAETPQKVVIYDPDRSVLYPGAFVQGGSYVVGSVDALTIPERAPLRISIPDIANPNGDNFRTVTPNQAEVENARGDIIGNAVQDGLSAPSSIEFKMETYHSERQFALEASLSGSYLNFSGSASGSYNQDASETTVAVQFTQRMYTVAVERPAADPASFFSDAFTPSRLQALQDRGLIGPNNLPVYVSEVVYGRMMMFTMTSTANETDIRATLQAAYNGIGGNVEASLTARQQSLLQNSEITVTSFGGNADATLAIIRSGNWADYFTEDAPLSSASPLSYTFRNLGDNSIAAVTEATDYTIRTCDARQATPGTYEFLAPQTLPLPFAPDVDGRAVGDVNGDGIDDLVFNRTGVAGNQTVAAVGDGAGGFSLSPVLTAPAINWTNYRFRTGDVDGDGALDLAWVEPGASTLTVYIARWTGNGFTMQVPQTRTASGWNTGYEPTLADVDGDGADDLVMNRANTLNRVWVFFANGDGTFDTASSDGQTLSGGGGWQDYILLTLDHTGDGRDDLVWNAPRSSQNVVHHTSAEASRTPTAPFTGLYTPVQIFPVGGNWAGYVGLQATGDFRGDGRGDILFPNSVGTAIHRAYGLGNGFSLSNASNYQRVDLLADGEPRLTHSVAANVNGDAIDDLVLMILDGVTNKTFVLLGQAGQAGLDDQTRVPQLHPEQSIAWGGYRPFAGRFNSDTRDDLVWLSTESSNRVFVGLARP
ncbi:MAG: thiol-activated cytolysin family protein [Bacteroidota bacterium]